MRSCLVRFAAVRVARRRPRGESPARARPRRRGSPDPIPNSEVKPAIAQSTAASAVGGRDVALVRGSFCARAQDPAGVFIFLSWCLQVNVMAIDNEALTGERCCSVPNPEVPTAPIDIDAQTDGCYYYMYVVECCDGSWYTGYTTDVERRVAEHNDGRLGAKYTRARRPVSLVAFAPFRTKSEAMAAEYHFKRLSRDAKERLVAESLGSEELFGLSLRRMFDISSMV